jgi:hypothetical protein
VKLRQALHNALSRDLVVDVRVRALGFVPLACFVVHFSAQDALGTRDHMWWMCHVAAVVLGVSLLASAALWVRIAAFWAFLGVPFWIFDWIVRGSTTKSSIITHTLVPLVGLLALTQFRMPRPVFHTAAACAFWLVVQQVSAQLTDPRFNVNVAHRPYALWGGDLVEPAWLWHVLATLLLFAVVGLCMALLNRVFPSDDVLDLADAPPTAVQPGEHVDKPPTPEGEPGFPIPP